MSRYDVFLNYSGPRRRDLEHLARKLREAGVEPFLDIWHLIPGEPRQEALETALDQSLTCAVFLGETLDPWQNEEMRSALERRMHDPSFRVIPVLLPGSREPRIEELPRFLRRLTLVDFRAGLDDADAFHRLLAGIRGEAPDARLPGASPPPRPYRCMAPPRELFVERREYGRVVDALCAREATGRGARGTTVALTTALHGAGGFGKTALALEICYDERVRERFPDGILWTSLGEDIDEVGVLVRILDLIRWWTEKDPPGFETVDAAGARLRDLLSGGRVLLIVDDVWHPVDVSPFLGLASGSALLVTSRDRRTLPAESISIEVDAMEIPAAVRLLGAGLPEGVPAELEDLAARLGEWPLLLKIVNRQLRDLVQWDRLSVRQALREVREALDAEGLTAFDPEDLESRNQAVARTLGASLRRLSPEDSERFEQLGIFPQDRDVPLSVLEQLWGTGNLVTKKLCSRLHDLSLLQRFDRRAWTIRLHDVVRAYLLKKREREIAALHRRLLAACRPQSGRWSDLPPSRSYLWRHLAHHLTGGGETDNLHELLYDLTFLQAKLEATEVNALLTDYILLDGDEEARRIQAALRLSAHVLARDPRQLAGQLLGRLGNLDDAPRTRKLLDDARDWSGGLWLRPRTPSLTGPGGPLIRTLEGHTLGVLSVAMLDHRRIVSASFDRTLRLWDLESGSTRLCVVSHEQAVNAVAVLGRGRVVSASSDSTLRLWDLARGRRLQSFIGHRSGVNGVANIDGWRVVSASSDGTLRIWDVETGHTLRVLQGHTKGVNAVVCADSRRAVSASADGTLRVWDVEHGTAVRILQGHTLGIQAVAYVDLRRVVSASDDETVRVWDLGTGQTLQVLEGHTVMAIAVLDSARLILGSADGTLRLWDLGTGQTLEAFKAHSGAVMAVAVLDDRRVVSASVDGTLRLWDFERKEIRTPLEGHSDAVQAFAMLDERRMVSASMDRTLRIWDLETGRSSGAPLTGHTAGVYAVVALGAARMISASQDRTLRLWNLDSPEIFDPLEGHGHSVNAVDVLDDQRMVSASADGTLRIWEGGETTMVLEGHSGGIDGIAVLDSRRLVTVSDDGTLRVWDLDRGECLRVIGGASGGRGALALLDGERALTSAHDGSLLVCDLRQGKIVQTLEGHTGAVHAVARLDARRVVSASADRSLRIWDLETGATLCQFSLEASVTAVAVSLNRRLLVAGDSMGRVHFFDLVGETGEAKPPLG
jgi:WD40 repeat protein